MNFDKFRDTAPLMQQTLPLSSLLNIGKFLSFDCGAVEGGGHVGIRCYRVCFEQELLKGISYTRVRRGASFDLLNDLVAMGALMEGYEA